MFNNGCNIFLAAIKVKAMLNAQEQGGALYNKG
jgi:hypothetical protein